MIDELALRKDLERAARAKNLLEDETLQGAFDSLEGQYLAAWRICPVNDTHGREMLWLAVKALDKVREHLGNVVADGELAKADLDRLTK